MPASHARQPDAGNPVLGRLEAGNTTVRGRNADRTGQVAAHLQQRKTRRDGHRGPARTTAGSTAFSITARPGKPVSSALRTQSARAGGGR